MSRPGELETAQLLTEKARAQLQGVRQELSAECAAAKAGAVPGRGESRTRGGRRNDDL